MMKQLRIGLLVFVVFTVITGVIYPLLVTAIGAVAFPDQVSGSLIVQDGVTRGSALIGQMTDDPAYFQGRPSAINAMQSEDGALTASAATNAGWTSAALAAAVAERAAAVRAANGLADDAVVPADLLFASASGIDPHISPAAAAIQIDRVATTRGVERAVVADLVARFTEGPQFGVLGESRVNVLLLNLALDDL